MALANCLGRLNIVIDDTDKEKDFDFDFDFDFEGCDIEGYDIDIEKDFEGFVADCLRDFFYNRQGFRYNSSQCNNLCHAFIAKLSKYFANNWDIGSRNKEIRFTRNTKCIDVSKSGERGKKLKQRAWKEIYRVVKEAQTYLQDCSNAKKWWMKAISSAIGGEAHVVHTHDLFWSLTCLDLNYSYLQAETEQSYSESACRKISDFHADMSGIHDQYHNIFLRKACQMEMSNLTHDHHGGNFPLKAREIAGIAKFLSAKLQAIILGEPALRDNRICSWLKIDSKDLIARQRLIGSGNFGKVYEGSWLGVKVAVKEIPLFNGDMDYLAPEIAAHAKLLSPFFVQLIGMCITETHCYFVMELVSSSLDKILKDRSKGKIHPLVLPVAVDMMLQISMGMEYLHSQKMMHMDLKAANVLIQPSALPEFRDHGYGRVKICDFGDASLRLCSSRCLEDTKGSCNWRAPEVFSYTQQKNLKIEMNAPKEYTYKADVYSFAMTCYEILTGKYPFEDVPLEKIYGMVVQGKRPSFPPSCPSVLADFIKKCWDTDPNCRPCFAEISNFMRYMKLLIMRIEDSRDPVSLSASCRDFDKAQLFKFECNEEEGSDDRAPNCFLQQSAQTLGQQINGLLVNLPDDIQQYSYKEMLNATENFSVDIEGVSCLMWKGTLPDEKQVAVKKQQFKMSMTEISMLCHLHRPNALPLRGISVGYSTYLAFDYMIMGSLAAKLFIPRSILSWTIRRKIGIGIARFVAYLHSDHMQRFLNVRINATDVFLDERFTPKFGIFGSILPIEVNSNSSSAVDQQQLELALLFEEFRNVHDLGVILLELLTGRRWENMEYSLQSILDSIQGDAGHEFVGERLLDRGLEGEVEMGEAMRWVKLALWCFAGSPSHKPSMNKLVLAMNGLFDVPPLLENKMLKSFRRGRRAYITTEELISKSSMEMREMCGSWEDMIHPTFRGNTGRMETSGEGSQHDVSILQNYRYMD